MPIQKHKKHKGNFPDFIIAGAMKSGTSSLQYILNQHKGVFIPSSEIFFYDIDDIVQHPDFFVQTRNGWSLHSYDKEIDTYLAWYKAFFTKAKKGQLIGEKSSTYLASGKAPFRIVEFLPNVKLLFILRDPVARAYSHYWHDVSAGRAIYSFEKTIEYVPGHILRMSFYKEQIERFKNLIPNKNMKFTRCAYYL